MPGAREDMIYDDHVHIADAAGSGRMVYVDERARIDIAQRLPFRAGPARMTRTSWEADDA